MKHMLGFLILFSVLMSATGCGKGVREGHQVFVLGLDGADFRLIDPWLRNGDLPNLKSVMDSGSSGMLKSTIPAISPAAWTSAITGKNPGKHGIFDFFYRKPGTMESAVTTSMNNSEKTIFEIAGDYGKKTISANIPLTYPPRTIKNGIQISGIPRPDSGFVYPPEMESEILHQGYKNDLFDAHPQPGTEETYLDAARAVRQSRIDFALPILKKGDWDLFWLTLMGTDVMEHYYWKYMDPEHPEYDPDAPEKLKNALHDFWIETDKAVGLMRDALPEGTIFVIMSDHGMAPVYREFRVSDWLVENGYLGIDPRKIKAYPFFSVGGNIFIYLKGREPNGVIEPGEEYRRLTREIADKLKQTRNPQTGEAVVQDIFLKDELFSGTHLDAAPDIAFTAVPGYFVCRGEFRTKNLEIFGPLSMVFEAYHRPEGILAISGDPVKSGYRFAESSIYDVTPTIMHLMGLPVHKDMDGGVLEELLQEYYVKAHPVAFKEVKKKDKKPPELEPELSEEFLEKMKSLSYVQ